MLRRPDATRHIITVHISSHQLWEETTAIDDAAGERAEFTMRVLDRRKGDRLRPKWLRLAKEMAALIAAPAVVRASLHQPRILPEILPILPDPELTAFLIAS